MAHESRRARRSRFCAAVVLLGLAHAAAAADPPLAFVHARVFRGDPALPELEDATVLVEDGVIRALGRPADVALPKDARVIDATGQTLLPGLIDLHVHLAAPGAPIGARVGAEPGMLAERMLACGVTTVLDLNAPDALAFALRARTRDGGDPGLPRILVTGAAITAPDGHGTEGGFPARLLDGPDAAGSVIDELAALQPDFVKVILDRGGWAGLPPTPSLGAARTRAIVDEAHARGFRVLAHAPEAELAEVALAAGVDGLAHLPFDRMLDDAALGRLKAGVPVMTTLAAYEALDRAFDAGPADDPLARFVDPALRAAFRRRAAAPSALERGLAGAARERMPELLAYARRLHEEGVTLLVGSDAGAPGVFHGASLHRELELLVQAGIPAREVLAMATFGAARFLGLEETIGTIRAGAAADLILVAGDPIAGGASTRALSVVVRAGRIFDAAAVAAGLARAGERAADDARPEFRFDAQDGALPELRVETEEGTGKRSAVEATAVRDYGPANRTGFLRLNGEVRRSARLGGYAAVILATRSPGDDDTGRPGAADGGFDARACGALRFRARAEGPSEFRVRLRTPAVKDGDYHGVAFRVGATWQSYRVPMDALAQIGFGKRVDLDLARVEGIEFVTEYGYFGEFRLDVDDVEFEPSR